MQQLWAQPEPASLLLMGKEVHRVIKAAVEEAENSALLMGQEVHLVMMAAVEAELQQNS